MAIIIEQSGIRCCFFHIPKTGGIWVEAALNAAGLDWRNAKLKFNSTARHATPWMVAEEYDTSFTFVRNHRDWYKSWWSFCHNIGDGLRPHFRMNPLKWHPLNVLVRPAMSDFQEFLDIAAAEHPAFLTRLYESYIGPDGAAYIGHVDSLENQPDSLIRSLQTCGIRHFDAKELSAVAKQNVSEHFSGDGFNWQDIDRVEVAAIRRWFS